MYQYQYGFIGSGNMAEAFVRGILQKSATQPQQVLCCDIDPRRLEALAQAFPGIATTSDLADMNACRILLLCVKPAQIADVCEKLHGLLSSEEHILISVAAGIPMAVLQRHLPGRKVVRAMPNTPALVGAGATGYCVDSTLSESRRREVQELFEAVGVAFELQEKQLDVVTALSGGGPAYICLVTEALADAGVRLGLSRSVAQALAAQTLLGTGSMILQTGEHPAVLREKVCSPGGTTIEGICALEMAAVRGAFAEAVAAAYDKAKLLGEVYNG